ncbi:C-24(28) sterol reductase [Ceratobasidium sp. UAMH 11750]|nr:C-24(28) sterol reductase [Ceratobasidium sp. UAMH 11750]
MYYLWIRLWFYDGQLVHPSSIADCRPFLERMWGHVVQHAYPTRHAFNMYTARIIFQLALAFVMPGYVQEGLPVPSLN